MQAASLDDLIALNDQLAALAKAGVPLELDLGSGHASAAALERINASVARRVSRGASLFEALEPDNRVVPPAYRNMVQLGLRVGDLYAGLDSSRRATDLAERSHYEARSALFYPLLVCCLALLGMAGFCFYILPTLQEVHAGLEVQPGSGMRVLQTLREMLPYWVAFPPLLLLMLIVWQFRSAWASPRWQTAFPQWAGTSRAQFHQRCAIFSEHLAAMIEAGAPLEESLLLAARTSDDPTLIEGVQSLAGAIRQGQLTADDAAQLMPPFLRWALLASDATIGRPAALRMAATIYRELAESQARRRRIVAPIVATVVIGGGAVLLYGLALFVPVVQMLESLGSPLAPQ